jgi:superfamily II DNA or RNA helicase
LSNSNYSRNDGKSKNIHEFSKKRVWLLFRKMQKRILFESCIHNYEQYEQEILFRKNEEKQSYVQERIVEQNESILDWAYISKSWKKWSTDKTTTNIGGIDWIANRASDISKESNVIGEVTSEMLQSRSCSSGNKISNRSRWEDTSIKALEILRQTKDGYIEKSWLDYIKIHKPASRRKSTEDCKENYVYNLEVAGNNNYFANSILVHNCHHYAAKTYIQVARHWNPKLTTGWTATPKRLDGLSLSNLFEKMVFQYDIRAGITDGFLAPIEAYQIKTQSDISRVKKTAGDFNLHQLSEAVDSELRNNLIVQKYKQYTPGRQGIAYCVDMNHAYHLRDMFRENGIKCETVVSDTERCPNRSYLIDRFKGGDIEVLTNIEILTEGFDYPDVGVIMMARPTQSETLYTQCMGRSTRLKSAEFIMKYGTDKAIVLDFVDNTGKLSLVNAFELEKDVPVADRMFLPAEHKEKLLEEEKRRRERRIKLEAGKDRKVDVLQLPKVQVWNSEKMLEPATDKQLQWIRSAGIFEEGIEYTKLQASELISNLPCQEWQIRYLAIHGYDVSKGASIGQYQKVKSNIENKQKYQVLGTDLKPVSKITDTWEN